MDENNIKLYDPTNKATWALILGIIGLFLWLIPFAGLIISMIGIASGRVGMRSSYKTRAIVGIVLCSISILLSIIAFIINILLIFLN
jgi:hypothetical protein